MSLSQKFLLDLLERVVATFIMAFIPVFTFTDLGSAKTAALAGGAAVLSLIKGIVAGQVGDKSSASLVQ